MAQHNDLGKEGEQVAIQFLRGSGFEILHCNWRHSHYEVDIIAEKENLLHFIEVKSRKFYPGVIPEESVSKKKFNFLKKAAEEYLFQHPEYTDIRFDILSITLYNNKEPDYFLIEDVFL